MNNEVWKRLPGIEVENEPHLPLCIYRDIKPNDFLALIHKTVKFEGKEIKIGPKLLGELAAKQLKNLNQSGFAESPGIEGIDKHSGSKTLHWVWIQGNPIMGIAVARKSIGI